ncbi:MAG: 50S ribosomal protein L1 [Candidatus Marinimicrobia bacterium]|nr:50S ribosomal protein L1 [Candidatus Neomarinimicrobiota bacterium]
MKKSKRVIENNKKIDRTKEYEIQEALNLLKDIKTVDFDETVEVHLNLGVNPKYSEQNVRGSVVFPNGTGQEVSVLVMTKSKVDEAQEAGADHVGLDEYIEKIEDGWTDVDYIVATPDAMGDIGKLGRILGPRGLMPNPKSGTLTNEVAQTIKELKAGKIEFKVDKFGVLHVPVGKMSFSKEELRENIQTLLEVVMNQKPNDLKSTYLQKITLSSTMGPGIKVNKSFVA